MKFAKEQQQQMTAKSKGNRWCSFL